MYPFSLWVDFLLPAGGEVALGDGKAVDHAHQLAGVLILCVEGVVTADGLNELQNCKILEELLIASLLQWNALIISEECFDDEQGML